MVFVEDGPACRVARFSKDEMRCSGRAPIRLTAPVLQAAAVSGEQRATLNLATPLLKDDE